ENQPVPYGLLDLTEFTYTHVQPPQYTFPIVATTYADNLASLLDQNTSITYQQYVRAAVEGTASHLDQVGSAGSFFSSIGSAAHIVISTVHTVFSDIGQSVDTFVVAVIDAAGNCIKAALRTIDDAVALVAGLFETIKATALDVIHFIRSVFDWSDIRKTA